MLVSGGYKIRDQSAVHFLTITVVEWVDVFTRQAYADIIIKSLEYCKQNKGLNLYAYVIMSNHVHLIVSASSGNLSDIVRDFKKFTSQSILKEIEQNTKESRRNWMLWLFESAGERKSNNVKYQFWQRDNRPKELTTAAMTRQKLEYIHNNPVKAGIVQEPHEYLYSSAKNYAGMDGLIKVDFLF